MGVHECFTVDLDDPSWMEQVRGDYRVLFNCVSSAGNGLAGYKKSYVDGQRVALAWARHTGLNVTFIRAVLLFIRSSRESA